AQFERDIEAATVGWSMMTAALYLDHALGTDLDRDPQLNPNRPTPTRRAVVLHRLARAARSAELPTLSELAAELRDELQRQWGDVPLQMAPAFRDATTEH
ncbi:MAG: hypothetical protein M3Y06_02885, partial [Actinomycetota bacterium]|nr:hypothetical protein [Actinomycetota bacterium]